MIIMGVGTAAAAGYSAYSQNQASKKMAGSMDNLPTAPNYQNDWDKGMLAQYKWAPWLAQQEYDLRQQYMPANAKLAADIYNKNLGTYAKANMRVLGKIDPQSIAGRNQLYGNVSNDLASGHNLTPSHLAEIQNDVRAAQTARGNYRGNAPISAEASVTGAQREQMYQQRVSNMMNFLRGPTPQDHFGKLAGAGASALSVGAAGAAAPGWAFVEQPRGFANDYVRNSQLQFQGNTGREAAIGQAQASAPAEVSPYAAALMGALGSAGSMYGAGGFGGGSTMSNAAVPNVVGGGYRYTAGSGFKQY